MNRSRPSSGLLFLSAALIALSFAPSSAVAKAATVDAQILTPQQALEHLKDGNKRFVRGKMLDHDLRGQVKATAGGQQPHSVILGCIDSRVPPEVVFDQGIGEVFSARIAGNFANTDIIGSMEFATKLAGSKLIVVMGHTSCGAVKGAADHAQLDNLTHLLSNLGPAVYAVDDVPGERNSKNAKFVDEVARENVRMTVDRILRNSDVISDLVEAGEVMVVGALYDISTGKVTFFD